MDSGSIRSATTCGGVDFDELASATGDPSYAFRLYMEKGDELSAPRTAVDRLSSWLDTTIQDIECQSEKRVRKFYIGKTYSQRHKKRIYNKNDPTTWRKAGISSRWRTHRKEEYGKSGMVVLTVITRDRVPKGAIKSFKNQQQYALALEQQLIMHYALERGDERLANETINPGKWKTDEGGGENEITGAIGYPIYMAYALEGNIALECDDPWPSSPARISSPDRSICTVVDTTQDNSDEDERSKCPIDLQRRSNITSTEDDRDPSYFHDQTSKASIIVTETDQERSRSPLHKDLKRQSRKVTFSFPPISPDQSTTCTSDVMIDLTGDSSDEESLNTYTMRRKQPVRFTRLDKPGSAQSLLLDRFPKLDKPGSVKPIQSLLLDRFPRLDKPAAGSAFAKRGTLWLNDAIEL